MTLPGDGVAHRPSPWLARVAGMFVEQDRRRAAGSWAGSVAVHGAFAMVAVALALRAPPPPREVEALSVEIVTLAEAQPLVEPEAGSQTDAPAEGAPSVVSSSPPTRFEVALPERTLPNVLSLSEPTFRGAPSIEELVPSLPSNVRAALAMAYYCRSNALGIAADLQRCPPRLDRFALEARLAQLDPDLFLDSTFTVTGRTRPQTPPTALPGLYRPGAAPEGLLPPKHADPAFGG